MHNAIHLNDVPDSVDQEFAYFIVWSTNVIRTTKKNKSTFWRSTHKSTFCHDKSIYERDLRNGRRKNRFFLRRFNFNEHVRFCLLLFLLRQVTFDSSIDPNGGKKNCIGPVTSMPVKINERLDFFATHDIFYACVVIYLIP